MHISPLHILVHDFPYLAIPCLVHRYLDAFCPHIIMPCSQLALLFAITCVGTGSFMPGSMWLLFSVRFFRTTRRCIHFWDFASFLISRSFTLMGVILCSVPSPF